MTKLKYNCIALNVWVLMQLLNNQHKILGKAHISTGKLNVGLHFCSFSQKVWGFTGLVQTFPLH